MTKRGESGSGESLPVEIDGMAPPPEPAAEPAPPQPAAPVAAVGGEGPNPLDQPRHGSELFVGNLPMNITEDELHEVFVSQGKTVHEVRIPVDPATGYKRQFGFVMFGSPEEAEQVMKSLDGFNLRGNDLRIKPSQSKNKLFIGGLPKEMSSADFESIVREHAVGIETVELVMDSAMGTNKGFGFVTFFNHASAVATKKRFEERMVYFGGVTPNIEFSKGGDGGRGGGGGPDSGGSKSVYIGGLPHGADVTEATLRAMFQEFGEIERIALPQTSNSVKFGFCHFCHSDSAMRAVSAHAYNPFNIAGTVLNIELARAPRRRRERRGGAARSVVDP